MNWVFDLDERSILDADEGGKVSSFPLSFPDKYPIKISLRKYNSNYRVDGNLAIAVKQSKLPNSDYLALGLIPIVSAGNSEYFGELNLNTQEVDDLLDSIESNARVKTKVINASLEVTLVSDEEEVSCLPIKASISRRSFISGNPGPTVSVSSLATQSEAEAGVSNVNWMSPLRTFQAISNRLSGIEFM